MLPALFGWNIHQNDKYFLTFLIATHLATAIVLLGFFLQDWIRIVKGLWRSLRDARDPRDDTYARLAGCWWPRRSLWASSACCSRTPLRKLFASPSSAALLPDRQRDRAAHLRAAPQAPAGAGDCLGDVDGRLAKLSWRQAMAVGSSQVLALIPGISRSGVTMGGGLLVGLSNEDAARFAFLLATPVIFAAAVLKLPELFGTAGDGVRGPALVAGSVPP